MQVTNRPGLFRAGAIPARWAFRSPFAASQAFPALGDGLCMGVNKELPGAAEADGSVLRLIQKYNTSGNVLELFSSGQGTCHLQ